MLGNATTHDRFGRREAEPPSRRTILALVVAIIAGAALCWYFRHPAQFPDRQRYTFGDRPPRPPRIDAALFADLGVIAGYVLVLGASAFIASRLAVSRLGASFGRFTRWALLVAATADLMKVLGLYLGTLLHSDPDTGFNGFVTVATAAMATIKTCSLVAALMAVPGALAVLGVRAVPVTAEPARPALVERLLGTARGPHRPPRCSRAGRMELGQRLQRPRRRRSDRAPQRRTGASDLPVRRGRAIGLCCNGSASSLFRLSPGHSRRPSTRGRSRGGRTGPSAIGWPGGR